jgi:protein-S-isoprenylcysteine O-methyltransferase Ste14
MEIWAIPLAWGVWAAVWVALAGRVKPVAERIDRNRERAHYAPLIFAALLDILPLSVFPLNARFVAFHSWLPHLGLLLVVAGLGYAIWARLTIAGNWSSDVTLKQGHELVVAGPYAWTRHPIYTGLLAAFLGNALAMGEWRGLIALGLAFLAFRRKIALEEALMRRVFGDAYAAYALRVKALIPWVY